MIAYFPLLRFVRGIYQFRMSAMSSRVLALFFCCLLMCTHGWSQSAPAADLSQEAVVFERLNESVRFEADGSGVRENTAVIRIQSQTGVRAACVRVFNCERRFEDRLRSRSQISRTTGPDYR